MSLATQLLRQMDDPHLSASEKAAVRCRMAKDLEDYGNYEGARSVLAPWWSRLGEAPVREELNDHAYAELCLRAGALSGWLGSAQQLGGSQEFANNLITQALIAFEKCGDETKQAECLSEMAWCYWREGSYNEARITLGDAINRLKNEAADAELKATIKVRLADVERATSRLNEALSVLNEVATSVESHGSHVLKGKYHNTLAIVLKNLGALNDQPENVDKALLEFAAASYHFEQSGHARYRARVENNLGYLYLQAGRLDDAHEHLDLARKLFTHLKDAGSCAQVDETRARALLAQGKNYEAERTAKTAVIALEKGGQQALLAEALMTQGTALARLKKISPAKDAFARAIDLAEIAGDRELAGVAALAYLEETSEWLERNDSLELYCRADGLLADSQHQETLKRLRNCARRALDLDRRRERSEGHGDFVHASEGMSATIGDAKSVAATSSAVLITGETGVGKEVLARRMHEWSERRGGPFIAVNCAAFNDNLFESQLFGHRKGSFTGAEQEYLGAAKAASGGTLFLDEVGELRAAHQAKLLRLAEYQEVATLGSTAAEKVDLRIISATNRNLKVAIADGTFRADLYYRLSAFEIHILPLRERPDDIPDLARHFIAELENRYRKQIDFTEESIQEMRRLPLPGNARELRSIIERTMVTAKVGEQITAEQVEIIALRQRAEMGFNEPWKDCDLPREVHRYERGLIESALKGSGGSLTKAAQMLGISHQSLDYMISVRHKDLLPMRKAKAVRRKSLMNKPRQKRQVKKAAGS